MLLLDALLETSISVHLLKDPIYLVGKIINSSVTRPHVLDLAQVILLWLHAVPSFLLKRCKWQFLILFFLLL